jgi:exodeoxyribonuclease VII large subunit
MEIDRLEALRSRPVLANASWLVDSRAEELGRYIERSRDLVDRVIERSTTRVLELTAQLRALSPQRTLARGYAIAQLPDGRALRSVDDAPAGTALVLTVSDGKVAATVDDLPAS